MCELFICSELDKGQPSEAGNYLFRAVVRLSVHVHFNLGISPRDS